MEISKDVLGLLHVTGQIVAIKTQRECKIRKGAKQVSKESVYTCRLGINYDNMKAVKAKRETGELPAQNAGLPWGKWAAFPYLIEHKDQLYLRCAVKGEAKYTYFLDDVVVSEEEAKIHCLAFEFKPKKDVFTIKVGTITEINHSLVS